MFLTNAHLKPLDCIFESAEKVQAVFLADDGARERKCM